MQGIIVGGVLAFITFQIIAHAYVTKINGWTTMYGCGEPGNGILFTSRLCPNISWPNKRAARGGVLDDDSRSAAGQKLSGQHDYIVHFPPGRTSAERCILVANHG